MTPKQEQFEKWKKKGIEWCLERLWVARNENKDARKNVSEAYHKISQLRAENDIGFYVMKRANELMAKVLKEHGIFPTKLRLTFIEKDCELWQSEGWCENWCEDCGIEPKTYIKEMSFYTYSIEENVLCGITADFKEKQYDLLKAVDVKTGEVIGEWNDKD